MTATKGKTVSKEAAEESAENLSGLKVVAPLVQVQVGDRVFQYGAGDLLPKGINEDSIEHLKGLGFITESD